MRTSSVLQKVPDLSVLTLTNTRVTDEGLGQLGRFFATLRPVHRQCPL